MGATIRSDFSLPLAPSVSGAVTSRAPQSFPRVAQRDFELDWATMADHPRIHQLLLATFHEPSLAEFQALNDAPRYDPSDRIVLRRDQEIAAHIHLVKRNIRFGNQPLATMDVKHLATLPEYRSRGLARQLHDASMEELRRAGVCLATVSARHPSFFAGMGWFPCGRYSYSEIRPTAFLAATCVDPSTSHSLLRRPARQWEIQVWRRNELDALVSLYERESAESYGLVERLDSDWRWLVGRGAFDHVLIARELKSNGLFTSENVAVGPIMGYAVVRDTRVLEIVADNHDRGIQTALLRRVCRDAMECSRSTLAVYAPPNDSLHALVREAGGAHCLEYRDNGRVVMAKITQPMELLSELRLILKQRAQVAGLPTPFALQLEFGDQGANISLGARTLSVSTARPTPHRVVLSTSALGQMLMGHRSAAELLQEGEIQMTTELARDAALALFPAVPIWRPQFDDEPA